MFSIEDRIWVPFLGGIFQKANSDIDPHIGRYLSESQSVRPNDRNRHRVPGSSGFVGLRIYKQTKAHHFSRHEERCSVAGWLEDEKPECLGRGGRSRSPATLSHYFLREPTIFYDFLRAGLPSFQSRAPATVEKTLPWREQDFVCEEPDQNDHDHDPDDLVHSQQFAAVVQEMA